MSRRAIGWFTGVLTVCGAAETLAINNVNAGWRWDLGASILAVVCALIAGWLAYRNAPDSSTLGKSEHPPVQEPGSVLVKGKVKGSIQTTIRGLRHAAGDFTGLGAGAVQVGPNGRVGGDIKTTVEDYGTTDGTSGRANARPDGIEANAENTAPSIGRPDEP